MNRDAILCLPLIVLLLFSCSPSWPTYSFNHASPLLEKGLVKMKIEVEFKKEAGVTEIKKNFGRVKYALQLVFRSMRIREVTGPAGMRKAENSIRKALEQQLKEEIRRVRISDYAVTENG